MLNKCVTMKKSLPMCGSRKRLPMCGNEEKSAYVWQQKLLIESIDWQKILPIEFDH